MSSYREIAGLIRRDAESAQMANLKRFHLPDPPRHRLGAAAEYLTANPRAKDETELWLTELLASTARPVDGKLSLYETFARTVTDLGDDVLDALPEHTKAAIGELAALAMRDPIPVRSEDVREMALALTVNGEFVAWLLDAEPDEPKPKGDGQAAYRRLAQRFHPDKGGDPDVMSDLNELWRASNG